MLRNIRGTRKDSSTAITSAGRLRKSVTSNKISVTTTFDDTLKAISSFVPAILLKNLIEERSAMRPHSSTMNGICLMADISGFTRLSGVFCSQGKDGLDGLQSATSGYMGSLVNAIYIYGGDVIKFAGDALVCIFEPTDESEEEFQKCCASALQCAWVLKDICTAELTLHVGISCGCICFGQLGGFENKWECLISGECIAQISKCLDVAPSKHVAITAEFYQHLLKKTSLELVTCEIAETTSDTYLVNTVTALSSVENILSTSNNATDDPLFLSQTACYVPRPVTQALMAGAFNFLAELREVTTVFMKMDGYDCAVHKDLLSLQKYFYACQEILSDSGGFMRQFLVDDKGCVLIALWGVPTATYHDDCRRALGASVRIRSKLLDMKMPCSFGITTGIVYCGNVGNEVRREYAAVGDVVNLAARLMSKAHGEILMDESTYHRLPEEVHRKLRKQPPMAVKGKDKPITSYQFDSTNTVQEDGRLGASLVDCALGEELPIRQVCRDAFTGPLNTLLSDSPAKEINFLILEGRMGTGREASIRWLQRRCNAKTIRMVSVRLKKADSSIDYRGLAKIFRHIIGEENFDDSERQTFVVNQLLRQMYPRDAETRDRVAYPTMRHTLAVSCPLNPAQRRKQSPKPNAANAADGSSGSDSNEHKKDFYFCSRKSSRCDEMFNADKPVATVPAILMLTNLKDIFSHLLAEQPTVLIIEDAHEMDELSWKVLSSLLKMQIKAFIVLTQEPIAYLRNLFSSVGTQTRLGELINPESILSYDWIEGYVNIITERKKSSYITLSEYSLKEVRTQIASTLKVPVKDLPKGLDHMAFNLSGGNPFWVDEISSFLVTYGVPEFISILETKKEGNSTNSVSNSSNHHGSESRTNIKNQGPDTLLKVIKPGVPKIARGSSSKLFNMFGTMKSGSKLEFLVVCRFAKLSVDEQSTARTASIIGTSFTADVLLNALPLQLGAYMPTILQSLAEHHWLQSKSEVNAAGAIRVEYSFSHPLMHQTLYDLTPSSVKRAIHLSIAQYIEGKHVEDKSHYISLGYHYSRTENTRKSYEYLARAAYEIIISEKGNLEESIMLLHTAATHISSEIDAIALLGVVCKGILRLKERTRKDSETLLSYSALGTKKSSTPLPTSTYTAVEAYNTGLRFSDLLTSIENVQYIYSDGTLGQTDEAVSSCALGQKGRDKGREKSKNKEKGKVKKEGVSINTPFSALSRRMKFGSNSTGDRSFKMMSSRSIGLLSDRSGSVMSHRSGGLLSHRSAGKDYDGMEDGSEDGVEDAARCLYQQRALRNGIEGACSVEQWQRPLIAIREYYISFPPPALEAPPRRISITNLMTSLVDSPKKPLIKPLSRTKLEAQTRAPSSYCVVS